MLTKNDFKNLILLQAQHDLNEVFKEFSYQKKISDLVRSLKMYKRPLSVQSMYLFKQPRIGGVGNLFLPRVYLLLLFLFPCY